MTIGKYDSLDALLRRAVVFRGNHRRGRDGVLHHRSARIFFMPRIR